MSQMPQPLFRQVSKIYPPQISQSSNRLLIYNPLEQWLESHTSSSLCDLIEISNYTHPLFLNNAKQIIMQDQHEVFFEEEENQWVRMIKKGLKSEKEIVSGTVEVQGRFVNINSDGEINVWKGKESIEQDEIINPESLKYIKYGKSYPNTIKTTIDSNGLVKEYRHGYNFAPIITHKEAIYSLNCFEDLRNNYHAKIVKTDLLDQEGQSSSYNCYLPQSITRILPFGNEICAFGEDNALFIDCRSESIVCNLNSEEEAHINDITNDPANTNMFYICRNNEILLFDKRNLSQHILTPTHLKFDEEISSMQLFREEQKNFCGVSFTISSKVIVAEL